MALGTQGASDLMNEKERYANDHLETADGHDSGASDLEKTPTGFAQQEQESADVPWTATRIVRKADLAFELLLTGS